MPELPEVETTARGLNQLIAGQTIEEMRIYDDRLRWPVDHKIVEWSKGCAIGTISRRSKYLLVPLYLSKTRKPSSEASLKGKLMIHLGMSGKLQVVTKGTPREKHSHLEWWLGDERILRYTDPRRFGSAHWIAPNTTHPLLQKLGPEPLTSAFNGEHLYNQCQNRTQAIKVFIMNAHIVVGVGNIYANEALFYVGIHPTMPAGKISKPQASALAQQIKKTLKKAIKAGGTTLRDFEGSEGKPGYFQQELAVYARKGESCIQCNDVIECIKLGQRATYFCPSCQANGL